MPDTAPELVEDLHEMLDRINRVFQDDFYQMDFFFCYKTKNIRTIFNVIRSLPNLLLRVSDYHPHSVVFQSTWTNVNNNQPIPRFLQGNAIRPRNRKPKPHNYFAHSFMGIPLAHQVNIFDYGFEILAESGIDMIAIKSECLADQTISHISSLVGQTVWVIPPVAAGVDVNLRYMWRSVFGDEFDAFIRKKQRGEPTAPKSKKSLIME